MKYYFKQAILPFIYLIFTAMLGMGIKTMGDKMPGLQLLLNIVNFLLYAIVVFMANYKDGEKAMDVRYRNDRFREVIVRTGEDITLNESEEYKPWKGFVFGAIACIPLVVFIIIHCFYAGFGGSNIFGTIGGILYMIIFSFFWQYIEVFTWSTFLYMLVAIPVISAITGFGFMIGAKNSEKKYEEIAKRESFLHGDKQ